jgi:hypothetical protein
VKAKLVLAVIASSLAQGMVGRLSAQGAGGQPGVAIKTPRASAPIDLTGYWVSVVTQDWRWRMVTPAKGDYVNLPMTVEAKKVADSWDPAKDEAAGAQCKSYGAPALMSVPGRVHIRWQDDHTLTVDMDAGMQTRVFHFGERKASSGAAGTWQGDSVAQWQTARPNVPLLLQPAQRTPGVEPPSGPKGGSLKVVTTHLRAGYLRKNGVPYSANTVLTEYWDVFKLISGDEWLTITTQTEDPLYLREPRLTALLFKKEPTGAKWDPTPCSSRW